MLEKLARKLMLNRYNSLNSVVAAITKAGLNFQISSECKGHVDGYIITDRHERAFVPQRDVSYLNKKYARITNMQERVLQYSVPIPLFMGVGDLSRELHKKLNSKQPGIEFDGWLMEVFGPDVAAVYLNKYFSRSPALEPYLQIIYESLEAFYMGLDQVAVMSLLPVIEGGLRNLQDAFLSVPDKTVSSEAFVKRLGEMIILHGRNMLGEIKYYPGWQGPRDHEIDFFTHTNEQCDVMNCFRLFFKEVLYKPDEQALVGFNRHLILHMLKNDFDKGANYVRLFIVLTHIVFCDRLNNFDIPMLWPGICAEDLRIGNYFSELVEKVAIPRNNMWKPGTPLPFR